MFPASRGRIRPLERLGDGLQHRPDRATAQLEVLDLGETNVSDRGIAELARLKNLHTLDLGRPG